MRRCIIYCCRASVVVVIAIKKIHRLTDWIDLLLLFLLSMLHRMMLIIYLLRTMWVKRNCSRRGTLTRWQSEHWWSALELLLLLLLLLLLRKEEIHLCLLLLLGLLELLLFLLLRSILVIVIINISNLKSVCDYSVLGDIFKYFIRYIRVYLPSIYLK